MRTRQRKNEARHLVALPTLLVATWGVGVGCADESSEPSKLVGTAGVEDDSYQVPVASGDIVLLCDPESVVGGRLTENACERAQTEYGLAQCALPCWRGDALQYVYATSSDGTLYAWIDQLRTFRKQERDFDASDDDAQYEPPMAVSLVYSMSGGSGGADSTAQVDLGFGLDHVQTTDDGRTRLYFIVGGDPCESCGESTAQLRFWNAGLWLYDRQALATTDEQARIEGWKYFPFRVENTQVTVAYPPFGP